MLRRVPTWPLAGLLVGLKLRLQMLCYWSLASRAEQGWMFFRWPWDGAATLLGPSGRPLATSPAVQGAARDYGGGGAQTAAQGRKGCRRAERAGNQHHARLARYMDRAARWLQHTAPATATGSHGGRGTVVRAEANPAASGPQRAEHGGAPRPHRGRQLQRTAATATAARTANSTARRKQSRLLRWLQHAAETGTAPAHVAATGGRSTESGGRRRGGAETARRCRKPSTATAAGWRQRPHRGRQLQHTAAAAAGPPAPAHSNSGRARRAAAQSTRQRRPGERRTADRTGNSGTNRAAHRDPDRQQKQRAWKDSLDQTPSWRGLGKPVASVAACVLERQNPAAWQPTMIWLARCTVSVE
jgi:hypothetical protein